MNTQLAFAFGMLTVIAIIMIVVIVVGLVKVIRQGKQINALNYELSNFIARVERSTALDDLDREINHRIDSVENHFISQLDSRLDKLTNKTDKSIEEIHKIFSDYINNNNKLK